MNKRYFVVCELNGREKQRMAPHLTFDESSTGSGGGDGSVDGGVGGALRCIGDLLLKSASIFGEDGKGIPIEVEGREGMVGFGGRILVDVV